jgi:glyceraldehyde 3-phosphate dehydrogenase
MVVDGREIGVLTIRDPAQLPWKALKVETVVDCTGVFTDVQGASLHLKAGAERVVISAPVKGDAPTVVMGINDHILRKEHRVISNGSCTTNCLAPMARVLHDAFGIQKGLMTTLHAYTRDQKLVDAHHEDLRRGRAAGVSMAPTSTGAASGVGAVIPELKGRLDGMAVRVPIADGSLVDLVALLEREASVEAVNGAFRQAAGGRLRGILEYSEDPLVSADVIGNPHSCVFDADSTMALGGNLVKVCGWYDNEWGYANRCVDLIKKLKAIS